MHALSPEPWYSPWEAGLFSLGLFTALTLAFIVAMLAVSAWIGEKRYNREKMRPYECGVIPTGTARLRYPVPFYLVAIFFLLFDVEGAFIFSYAVSFRELGWQGWYAILFFIGMLMFGLFYVWKKGGLDWSPVKKRT
jgi:NADH-quinone oxidoreductase subunit A